MKRLLALLIFVVMPLVMIKAQFGVEQPFFGSTPQAEAVVTNLPYLVGLEYWWNFNDLDTNNASVSNWVDRIQGSKFTNGASGTRPICTSTGVFFSGSTLLTNIGATVNATIGNSNTHMLIAWIASAPGAGETRCFLSQDKTGSAEFPAFGEMDNVAGGRFGWGNASPAFPSAYQTAIWMDIQGVFGPELTGANSGIIWTNGYNALGVTNTTMGSLNGATWRSLGFNQSSVLAVGLRSTIREILIYSNDLSLAQIQTNHFYTTNQYKFTP